MKCSNVQIEQIKETFKALEGQEPALVLEFFIVFLLF